jgi:hypothetical protein
MFMGTEPDLGYLLGHGLGLEMDMYIAKLP